MLEKFPAPVGCTALVVDDPAVLRTINDAGELDCLTFSGSNGDAIRVRVVQQSGTINPVTEVFRADGTTVCANTFSDDFVCNLTSNGTHTILVRDGAGNGEGTGNYTVRADEL